MFRSSLATGKAQNVPVRRGSSVLAAAAPNGSACLVIDRTSGTVAVRLYLPDGSLVATWSPKPSHATPVASPVAQSNTIGTGDEIVSKPDSSGAAVAIAGVGVFVADSGLKMREVQAGSRQQ